MTFVLYQPGTDSPAQLGDLTPWRPVAESEWNIDKNLVGQKFMDHTRTNRYRLCRANADIAITPGGGVLMTEANNRQINLNASQLGEAQVGEREIPVNQALELNRWRGGHIKISNVPYLIPIAGNDVNTLTLRYPLLTPIGSAETATLFENPFFHCSAGFENNRKAAGALQTGVSEGDFFLALVEGLTFMTVGAIGAHSNNLSKGDAGHIAVHATGEIVGHAVNASGAVGAGIIQVYLNVA